MEQYNKEMEKQKALTEVVGDILKERGYDPKKYTNLVMKWKAGKLEKIKVGVKK